MDDPQGIKLGDFSKLSLLIAEKLRGLDLLDADRTLDDTRRLVMLSVLSGAHDTALHARVEPSLMSDEIAALVRGLDMLNAVQVLDETRLYLFMVTFAKDPASAFGQHCLAYAQRQALPANPVKLT